MAIISTAILTSSTDIYVSAGNNAITSVIICNTATPDPSVGLTYLTLHAVASGDGVGATNMIVNQLPIPAGETVNFDTEKMVLSNGDKLVAFSASPANLSVTVSTLPV